MSTEARSIEEQVLRANGQYLREAVDKTCAEMDRLRAVNKELLQALEQVMDVCIYNSKLGWDKTVAQAEAAIAKARGIR